MIVVKSRKFNYLFRFCGHNREMRRFFEIFPLMSIPIGLYAIIAILAGGTQGVDIFATKLERASFYMPLPSGAAWGVSAGTLLVALGLIIFFIELSRGVGNSKYAIIHHTIAVLLSLGCLGGFLAIESFGTSTFFLLLIMCLLDMIGGVIVNIAQADMPRGDY